MQRNVHLFSNGGGNKGQAEPLRMKRARKNYHPQDTSLLSYSDFPSQFHLGKQTKVFHRIQDAIWLLVIFLTYPQFNHKTLKTSVCCAETKSNIKSGGKSTSKINE